MQAYIVIYDSNTTDEGKYINYMLKCSKLMTRFQQSDVHEHNIYNNNGILCYYFNLVIYYYSVEHWIPAIILPVFHASPSNVLKC